MNQFINGILAPIPTFFNADHTLNCSGNLNICKIILRSEVSGLFLLGTTGEFSYLSFEQKKNYIEYMNSNLKTNKPVVYCVHHWNTKKSLELTEIALKNGSKILSAMIPAYFSISDENIIKYYTTIRSLINNYDSSIPLILYHIPLLPGTISIKPEIVVELTNAKVIQGIKDSVIDIQHAQKIIENVSSDFIFLCGTETLLLNSFRNNNLITKFNGGVFSGAVIAPNTYSRLLNAGRTEDKENFLRIWPLVDEITTLWDDGINFIPGICKYAIKYMHFRDDENFNYDPCSPLPKPPHNLMNNTKRIINKIKSYWGSHEI